jgi:hypothetical protein
VFEVEGFDRAAIDRFWLAIAADDPALDRRRVTEALASTAALRTVWLAGPVGGPP